MHSDDALEVMYLAALMVPWVNPAQVGLVPVVQRMLTQITST